MPWSAFVSKGNSRNWLVYASAAQIVCLWADSAVPCQSCARVSFPTGWQSAMTLRKGGEGTSSGHQLHKQVIICWPFTQRTQCTEWLACCSGPWQLLWSRHQLWGVCLKHSALTKTAYGFQLKL